MKHKRTRRTASTKGVPSAPKPKPAVDGRLVPPRIVSILPSEAEFPAPNKACAATFGIMSEGNENARRERRLTVPPFVTSRCNGGTFNRNHVASPIFQPRDFVRLRQKELVRWRLSRWTEDLLSYTQAQPVAKARLNTLIKVSATPVPRPDLSIVSSDADPKGQALPVWFHPKLGPMVPNETGSLLLGVCLSNGPANEVDSSG